MDWLACPPDADEERIMYINRDAVNTDIYEDRQAWNLLLYLLMEADPKNNTIKTSLKQLCRSIGAGQSKKDAVMNALLRLKAGGFIELYKLPSAFVKDEILIALRKNDEIYIIRGEETFMKDLRTINLPKHSVRAETGYYRFRKAVLERDKYQCRNCGSLDNLEVHHIRSYADYPQYRVDVTNGITLCHACHMKEHHGGKSNGEETNV